MTSEDRKKLHKEAGDSIVEVTNAAVKLVEWWDRYEPPPLKGTLRDRLAMAVENYKIKKAELERIYQVEE